MARAESGTGGGLVPSAICRSAVCGSGGYFVFHGVCEPSLNSPHLRSPHEQMGAPQHGGLSMK